MKHIVVFINGYIRWLHFNRPRWVSILCHVASPGFTCPGFVGSRSRFHTFFTRFLRRVAGHPLAQNERCLHMFLQDKVLDKNYTPSKIRQA